jgi:hypothetical protein
MEPGTFNRTLNNLLPLLWALGCLSPVVASVCAASFYGRHRRARPDTERHLSVIAYVVLLLVCAVVAYPIGATLGIPWACSADTGNLCGIHAFFVVGPFASALTIFVVGGLIASLPADVEPVPVVKTWSVSSTWSKFWNGQYSLAASFWGFFVAGYFASLTVGGLAAALLLFILPVLAPLFFALVPVVYEIVAAVAVWRSADARLVGTGGESSLKNADSAKTIAAKIVVVAVVVWLIRTRLLSTFTFYLHR